MRGAPVHPSPKLARASPEAARNQTPQMRP
jgi:hypothetical protein